MGSGSRQDFRWLDVQNSQASALSRLDLGVAALIVERLSQPFSEAVGTTALLSTPILKLDGALAGQETFYILAMGIDNPSATVPLYSVFLAGSLTFCTNRLIWSLGTPCLPRNKGY